MNSNHTPRFATVDQALLDQFTNGAVWRLQAWLRQAMQGQVVAGSHQLAGNLDAIDLHLRRYLITGHSLASVSILIGRYLTLCPQFTIPVEEAQHEIFSLLLNAYRQAFELELYECMPRLQSVQASMQAQFFCDPALPRYTLPDPNLSPAEQLAQILSAGQTLA